MKEFGNKLIILLFTAFFAACGQGVVIEVANPSGPDRDGELAEVSLRELSGLPSGGFRLLDASGEEVAYQLTSDSLLVFPVRVRAGVTAVYRVVKGTPSRVDTVATGSFRPDRMGDIIWENDRCGWRTYGPPTRAVGQAAYGYDVFTKSISRPVMAARFDRDRDAQPEIRRLRAAGRNAAADSLARSVSYHVDHGDGMDVYPVGGSLGCGTAALLEEGRIVFPWTWASYEFLDNGPLRFRMKLTMEPFEYKGRMVTETRVVTCDAGSSLNRAEISYDGLDEAPLSVGIVVHATHPDAWRAGGGCIAYAELGDPDPGSNGEIYCGAVLSQVEETVVEQDHIQARTTWHPGFVYWFGASWSKAGIAGLDTWQKILGKERERVLAPLQVRVR